MSVLLVALAFLTAPAAKDKASTYLNCRILQQPDTDQPHRSRVLPTMDTQPTARSQHIVNLREALSNLIIAEAKIIAPPCPRINVTEGGHRYKVEVCAGKGTTFYNAGRWFKSVRTFP